MRGSEYMGIAIDATLIENINEPSLKVLAYCIAKHQESIERFDRLNDYYNGNHDIEDRTRENELAPNTKVTVNHAKYITDMVTGVVFGNPVSYTPGDIDEADITPDMKEKDTKKNIDAIMKLFKKIDISAHDAEVGKDLSVTGEGLEVVYVRKIEGSENATEPMIKSIDPRGAFVVTDDTINKNYLFAVHYMQKFDLEGNQSGYRVDVYTKKYIITLLTDDITMNPDNTIEWERKENIFKDVQITEFRNNEEKQGDFEQQISLINAFNNLQSDRIADKEAFIDAILIFYGFKLDEGGLGPDALIEAPAKNGSDGGAAAEYLTKVLDEDSTQVLAQSIEDNIHKTSYIPNMNDEKFSGNVSGEAMKYKLFALLQLMSVKSRYFYKGLRRRLQLLENYYTTKKIECDVDGIEIAMTANIPVNVSEIITMINNAKDVISLRTLLKLVPFIDDPDRELERLILQRMDNIKLQRQALGEQSHNESVVPPKIAEGTEEDEEEEIND